MGDLTTKTKTNELGDLIKKGQDNKEGLIGAIAIGVIAVGLAAIKAIAGK